MMADEEIHRSPTEARAGTTPGIVRYILLISTGLLVTAFAVILLV
jgi:hypothetical protein